MLHAACAMLHGAGNFDSSIWFPMFNIGSSMLRGRWEHMKGDLNIGFPMLAGPRGHTEGHSNIGFATLRGPKKAKLGSFLHYDYNVNGQMASLRFLHYGHNVDGSEAAQF